MGYAVYGVVAERGVRSPGDDTESGTWSPGCGGFGEGPDRPGGALEVRERASGYGPSENGGGTAPQPGLDPDPDPVADPDAELDPDLDPSRFELRPGGPLSDEEVDELEALAARIGEMAAHLHAAEREFLKAIAEFDRREGWKLHGHSSPARWLAFWTGLDLRTARTKVRVARALGRLPLVGAAMGRGELSFSKVRAISRLGALDPEEEATMVEFARKTTAAELEKVVRQARYESRADEAAAERLRHARRSFAVYPDEGGMYQVRGTLDPEVGAQLMRVLEWAGEWLYRREKAEPLDPEAPTPEQRRADAVALLVERAIAAGLPTDGPAEPGTDGPAEPGSEAVADPRTHGAAPEGGPAEPPPLSACACGGDGRAAAHVGLPERFQAHLHLGPEALVRGGDPRPAHSHLEDGIPVSVETARRLTCDAAVVPVLRNPEDGSVLDIGRRSRVVPPAIRRALQVRDGGCRWPGCGLRFVQPHHVDHWADGGPTSLDNLVSLCPVHHRAVHEDGFRVESRGGGSFRFHSPEGWPLGDEPPCLRLEADDPAVALILRNRRRGIRPRWDAASADYPTEASIPRRLLRDVDEVAAGRWLARGRARGELKPAGGGGAGAGRLQEPRLPRPFPSLAGTSSPTRSP